LFIAVCALVMPAVYEVSVLGGLHHEQEPVLMKLSLWTSAALIVVYFVSFLFVFKTHKQLFGSDEKETPSMSKARAVMSLACSTALIAWLSELLVGGIEAVTHSLGWTELFVGVVVVAIVGNAAEHSTAVVMARKDKMDISLGIAAGSSTQ